jgi:Dolichyl-phosphate-mannose-protein mannosyltransferase
MTAITLRTSRRRPAVLVSEVLRRPDFLPWIVALGLLFRVALLVATRHNAVFPDEFDYERLGVSLWKAHAFALAGLPTAYRAPGEPFLIAGIYALFGEHSFLIKLAQALLLSVVPFFCARLARGIGLGIRAANLSALFASLHPALAYAATTLYPTALTAVALTAGIVYCAAAHSDNKTGTGLKGGLALGVAASATTTLAPLPLLIACGFLVKKKLRLALVIGLLGMLPTLGWLVRNHAAMGAWVMATNGGVNLQIGATDQATPRSGNWVVPPKLPPGDEIAINHIREEAGLSWIRQHPVRYAALCVGRALAIVDSVGKPMTPGLHTGLSARIVGWAMFPIVVLGFAGIVLYRRTPAAWFTAAALALVIVSSALTIVKPRLRFPCDPLLGTFAAATLARLSRRAGSDNSIG